LQPEIQDRKKQKVQKVQTVYRRVKWARVLSKETGNRNQEPGIRSQETVIRSQEKVIRSQVLERNQ
jgi:hypothetical protein